MSRKNAKTKLSQPSLAIDTWDPTRFRRLFAVLRLTFYTLDSDKPVYCADPLAWSDWFFENSGKTRVATTEFGPYRVSTVFTGIDYNPGDPPPALFETVICGLTSRAQWSGTYPPRYSTWEKAEAGHESVVRQLRLKLQQHAKIGAVKERRAKRLHRGRHAQDQRRKATRKRVSAGSGE